MKKLFTVIFSLALLTACSNQTGAVQQQTQATAEPSPSPSADPNPTDSPDNDSSDGHKKNYWQQVTSPCDDGHDGTVSYAVRSDDQDFVVCRDGTLFQFWNT